MKVWKVLPVFDYAVLMECNLRLWGYKGHLRIRQERHVGVSLQPPDTFA